MDVYCETHTKHMNTVCVVKLWSFLILQQVVHAVTTYPFSG